MLLNGRRVGSEIARPEGFSPSLWLVRALLSLQAKKLRRRAAHAHLRSGAIVEQGNDLRLLVVLEADTIVVTMPGTSYSVSYRKLHDTPWLVASDIPV